MRLTLFLLFLAFSFASSGQNIDAIINAKEVDRVERTLSSDEMKGRATFSPQIEMAASFISKEFKQAGLQPLPGATSYLQPFIMIQTSGAEASGTIDGHAINGKDVVAFTSDSSLTVDEKSGYEVSQIKAGDKFMAAVFGYVEGEKSRIVFVDSSYSKAVHGLSRFNTTHFKSSKNVVFVVSNNIPTSFSIHITQKTSEGKLANVVGMLPGKTKPEEFVIFSAHYDHLGAGKPNAAGDSIFNGANDDASGTTAVIMLAKYYGQLHNNERSIIFAAFTAEEIGEYGSAYFSNQFDPVKVQAMFNIEMIGTESKWGKNSAFITGYEKTDMGKIMEKNLVGSGFTFYPDPYPAEQLFYRSDNATLARKGVPAHTISTSKMDSEKFYHTQGDEISTLDMENMARIIKSIAISASSVVAGKDTPSRVDASGLR